MTFEIMRAFGHNSVGKCGEHEYDEYGLPVQKEHGDAYGLPVQKEHGDIFCNSADTF